MTPFGLPLCFWGFGILAGVRQRFDTEQWLPFPVGVVFGFFADPRNLPPLMPAWQRARIEEVTLVPPAGRPAGVDGVFAGDGTRLLITARVGPGVPVRVPWLARIEDFRWSEGFCDVQVKGPFAYWRHCHSVREEDRGGVRGTVVRDAVEYELPVPAVSWMGAWVGPLAMGAMFGYRQRRAEALVRQFAAGSEGS